jgi:hypothetical protein
MLDIEHDSESFKESITERLERHENDFNNLVNTVKSIKIAQKEYKKRLRRLEDGRNHVEKDDIELQYVRDILFFIFLN